MNRSLKGKKILVTREESQAKQFSDMIEQYDGISVEVPLLKIHCREVEKNIPLNDFDWIFFTSAHGVDCFFKKYTGYKFERKHQFATVGHKTEKALKKYGYKATFIPSTYNAEVMAKEFFNTYPNANHILLVRGNLSREILVTELKERQLTFETVVVYDTMDNIEMKESLLAVLREEDIDFLTFTSPSTVKAFMKMVRDESCLNKILQLPCVCIGTTTEKIAHKQQFTQTIVPQTFTIENMVESMIDFINLEE